MNKYRISIPKSVKEAYAFDKYNSNKLWTEGINEEINKARISVQESNVYLDKLIGYQEIGLHMIFDNKRGKNLWRKGITVDGGHTKKIPSSVTYSSVVSWDSVLNMLMVSDLNALDLKAVYI